MLRACSGPAAWSMRSSSARGRMSVCRFPEDHRRSRRKHADPTVRAADKKCIVQIIFKTSGGIAYFPGLAAGKKVDVDTLPQDRQAEIHRLLESTKFFDLPA